MDDPLSIKVDRAFKRSRPGIYHKSFKNEPDLQGEPTKVLAS